jgi:DNA replication initiation complex subunit (GINS family)
MKEDEINYRTLREIQQLEKKSPILTELKTSFYFEITKFIEELKTRLQNESSSQKQTLINEEMENIQKISINIYELREKKILLAAITKARGGNPDIKNMINTEKKLFDSILNILNTSRIHLLKNKTNENEKIEIEEKKEEPEKIEEKPIESNDINKKSNPIVRVIEDVPEFIGTNEMRYNLRKNDILSLPEDMCKMLSGRGVVKKINN